jgi:rhodanese-related sulfurtransferase
MSEESASKYPVEYTGRAVPCYIAIKEGLIIAVLAFMLGSIFNYSILLKSINGSLIGEIQQKQLNELKVKVKQLVPGIAFIDLISAKKLYDEGLAVILDARSGDEYKEKRISKALNLSVTSVVRGDVVLENILPDKNASIITYCDGGECDIGVELAKELIERGYKNVYVLGEGYPGWEASGYPMEKSGVL